MKQTIGVLVMLVSVVIGVWLVSLAVNKVLNAKSLVDAVQFVFYGVVWLLASAAAFLLGQSMMESA